MVKGSSWKADAQMRVELSEDYSHSIPMDVIDRSTPLEASADAIWAAVKTPAAFRKVARGLIAFPILRGRESAWNEGETVVGWVFLFGFLPFSRHNLHITEIDDSARILRSEEKGGLVKRWNHQIFVTPIDQFHCTYRDRIEISAGIVTPFIGLYARWFYRMRQRRWRSYAKKMNP